ncbi:MAG: ABC transporter ATP-binding protein, partial [Chitinophagaceae bacterium]|nr:ABC transporter ATP-binding protein [Chitinophagaceae bacterium]
MIQISGLQKVYRTEEVETNALNNITMEVKRGEFV